MANYQFTPTSSGTVQVADATGKIITTTTPQNAAATYGYSGASTQPATALQYTNTPGVSTSFGGTTTNPGSATPPPTSTGAILPTQPVVTPNQNGSLQNTLTTPTPPTTPPPASSNGGTPPATPSTQGMDPNSFTSFLGNINSSLQQNNQLVDQKNAVVQAMLGNPVDPATLAKLPPDIQSIIQSGDRNALLLQAKILNNSIQGKNDATAQSIKYLTSGYQTSVQDAEKQKQDAIQNVLSFAQTYGSGAGKALSSLYGPEYVQQLKDMGIDVDSFSSQPTLDQTTAANKASGGGGSAYDQSDPTVQAYVSGILSGNITSIASVPAQYRDAVAIGLEGSNSDNYSPLAASRYTLAANRIEGNFLNLPQYLLTSQGLPYLQRIDAAEKTPGSISDQDLLDSLTKLNTAGNAISDAQVKIITDGQSFSDWANVLGNKFKNGGVLSDGQRQQIQSIAKAIYANYAKGYQPVYDQVTSQLTAAGIPKAFWTIPDLNDLAAKGGLTGSEGETSNTDFSDIQKYITVDGNKAYIPRSVWSTLGDRMDALLAEAKADGYTLLIKD